MARNRYLLLTQDPALADACSRELQDGSCEVIEVRDAGRLPVLLDRGAGLVLVDLNLPDLSLRSIAEVLAERRELPVVVLAAGSTAAWDELSRGSPLEQVVEVPVDGGQLTAAVSRLLERSRFLCQHLVGNSEAIRTLREQILLVGPTPVTVLITGESGSGKDVVARALHHFSGRDDKPYKPINCAAIPENLLENELFGHERGAFTDARSQTRGIFEQAHKGTVFLDEIGEMARSAQVRLLRVLEERRVTRIGGDESIEVDVRMLAASNKDLLSSVSRGEFRRDLYHRLKVVELYLPPLRERREDIALLLEHFVEIYSRGRKDRIRFHGFTTRALDLLAQYDWPGNVRELRNLVEHLVFLGPAGRVDADDLLPHLERAPDPRCQPARPDLEDPGSVGARADLLRPPRPQAGGRRPEADHRGGQSDGRTPSRAARVPSRRGRGSRRGRRPGGGRQRGAAVAEGAGARRHLPGPGAGGQQPPQGGRAARDRGAHPVPQARQVRVQVRGPAIRALAAAWLLACTAALPAAGQSGLERFEDLSRSFRSVYDRVAPAVVLIQTSGEVHPLPRFHPPVPRGDGDGLRGLGSGVIVSADGHILSNHHVIKGADSIRVTLHDRRRFPARVVGVDSLIDIALLEIDAPGLPVASLGRSEDLLIGDWVLAIGYPLGMGTTLTHGIVSALGRRARVIEDDYGIESFIQTNAVINPGNSGGPLLDLQGRVVGINTAISTRTGFFMGYGLAVPIDLAREAMDDFLVYGRVVRGYLGVEMSDVDDELVRREDLDLSPPRGVFITRIEPRTPADRSGLSAGDVVLAIDGQPVDLTNEVQTRIYGRDPGERVELTVLRAGRRHRVPVVLGEREESLLLARGRRLARRLGLTLESMTGDQANRLGFTREQARRLKLPESAGAVVITEVEPGSPAARLGLEVDDVITEIDRTAIASLDQFARDLARLKAGESALLWLWRRGRGIDVRALPIHAVEENEP